MGEILPGFNKKLADFAKRKLIERGIEIQLKKSCYKF